jgi:hypothetical protein
MGHGFFLATDAQDLPDITIQDLFQSANDPTNPSVVDKLVPSCPYDAPKTNLAAGESVTATKALAVGELGLPAGPAQITTVLFGASSPPNPIVPITLPSPTTTPINRSDAINLALAQPDVAQLIPSFPEMPASGTTGQPVSGSSPDDAQPDRTPPTTSPTFSSAPVANPVDGGWQIGYASGDYAFLVKVNNDGSIGSVETSASGH